MEGREKNTLSLWPFIALDHMDRVIGVNQPFIWEMVGWVPTTLDLWGFFWGVKLFLRVWLKRCQMKTQLTMNKIFWIWKWSFPTSKSHLQSFQPIELRDAFEFLDLVDLSLDQSNSICCPPWNQQFAPKKSHPKRKLVFKSPFSGASC